MTAVLTIYGTTDFPPSSSRRGIDAGRVILSETIREETVKVKRESKFTPVCVFVHPGSELKLNYFREGSVSLLVPISTNP